MDRRATLSSIAGHTGALPDGPFIIIRPRKHVKVVDGIELRVRHVELSIFDIIVVPAEGFAGLDAWDEFGPCHKEEDAGN